MTVGPPAPFAPEAGCGDHASRSKSSRMTRLPGTRRSTTGDDGSLMLPRLRSGSDETLCVTHDGLICEASRSNIFLVEGRRLCTPSLDGPLLPGVMRRLVLERAEHARLQVEEVSLPIERIQSAEEAFLTNSVRGIVTDRHADGRRTASSWPGNPPALEQHLALARIGGINAVNPVSQRKERRGLAILLVGQAARLLVLPSFDEIPNRHGGVCPNRVSCLRTVREQRYLRRKLAGSYVGLRDGAFIRRSSRPGSPAR